MDPWSKTWVQTAENHPNRVPKTLGTEKRVDVSPWNFISMDLENANVITNPFGLQATMWLQHLDCKVQQWSRHLLSDACKEWTPTLYDVIHTRVQTWCANLEQKNLNSHWTGNFHTHFECMMTEQILPCSQHISPKRVWCFNFNSTTKNVSSTEKISKGGYGFNQKMSLQWRTGLWQNETWTFPWMQHGRTSTWKNSINVMSLFWIHAC